MSSRRKSKPARWIESICSRLKETSKNAVDASEAKEEIEQNGSLNGNRPVDPSPEASGSELPSDKLEGVYVIEPESVSDNEGPHRETKPKNTEGLDAGGDDTRKRSNMGDVSAQRSTAGESSSGLDLSVKRQKIDLPYADPMDLDKMDNLAPFLQSASTFAHLTGNEMNGDQFKKYQQLAPLLATGKSLIEAMDEVGLSAQQFIAMHWLNQFNSADPKHKEISTEGFENGPKQVEEELPPQQKQITLSRPQPLNFPLNESNVPVSMYNIQDHPSDDNQASYRNFLLRTCSLLPRNESPGLLKPSDKRNDVQADSIAAGTVSSGVGSIKRGTLDPSNFDEDVFDQYIAKFTNANRCGLLTCQYYTRDHYHCVVEDCKYQRFTNKADVIRHYNMHKKRDNSLAHGFLRFSPTDDCSSKYPNCHLNGKSTHYHCMQPDCNKVYTSTSDVMTHENFHKKYMQFVCSGFKRFRATEQCDLESCVFRNQKTTHFHCTRADCNFTFKNKCDIEKHKTYHMRDDQYIRKGFKKFYKNETCGNVECVWNQTANHFHCLRTGCNFSFTSTSQMESHKRKHDRNDYLGETKENALDSPRNSSAEVSLFNPIDFQSARSVMTPLSAASRSQKMIASTPIDNTMENSQATGDSNSPQPSSTARIHTRMQMDDDSINGSTSLFSKLPSGLVDSLSTPKSTVVRGFDLNNDTSAGILTPEKSVNASNSGSPVEDHDEQLGQTTKLALKNVEMETVAKYMTRSAALKCRIPDCEFLTKDHYHCMVDSCEAAFSSDTAVSKHARFHLNLEMMGVSLPLQSRPSIPTLPPTDRIQTKFALHPTLGSIAFPSTLAQSSLPSGSTSPMISSDGQGDAESSKASSEADMSPYSTTVSLQNTDFLASQPTQIHPSILKGIFTQSDACQSMINSQAFRNLSFLSALSPVLASAAHPKSSATENIAASNADGKQQRSSLGNGYIHFRDGMPCLRGECKYTHQSHWHCTLNRCRYVCKSLERARTHREAHDSLDYYARSAKENFRSYSVKKQCPYPACEYRLRGHYHCMKPECSFTTIGTSKLPWHMKKHEKIAKREANGFKYFTKNERCQHSDCKYNIRFSHYHCVRKGCTFAFQYKHQMSTHVRKHLRRMLGRSAMPSSGMQADDHANVESGDDGSALVIDEMDDEQQPISAANSEQDPQDVSMQQYEDPSSGADRYQSAPEDAFDRSRDDDGVLDLSSMQVISQGNMEMNGRYQIKGESMTDGETPMETSEDGTIQRMDKFKSFEPSNNVDLSPAIKSSPEIGRFSKFKLETDVLDGFSKFDSNQDCGNELCSYRYKMGHFHCMKENCNYNFTGRSHMFKHYQHHERVAGLVRNDFKRYKASQPCDDAECEHKGRSTHFHCLRCQFKCTDSAKVGTHRRQHMKADALEQSGFQRVRGKDDCERPDCKYRFRSMSHFHCLQPGCSYTVVGLSGIEVHAEKHKRGLLQPSRSKSMSLAPQSLVTLQSLSQLGIALNDSSNSSTNAPPASNDYSQNATENPPSPTDGSDNGHSNRSSPFLPPAQDEPGQLLSNFTILSSSQSPIMATSPVSSNPLNRVTEGVGS